MWLLTTRRPNTRMERSRQASSAIMSRQRAARSERSAASIASESSGPQLPPGVTPDEEALGEIVQRPVAEAIRDDVFAVFEPNTRVQPTAAGAITR